MTGSDRKRGAPMGPSNLCFVLVEPQMGENIGAAARAMWNFGLDRLRIVSPRDGWPNPAAVAMSSGAGRLLEDALIYESTAEAVADAHVVFATTARPRGMIKRVVPPETAMAEARDHVAAGQRVAILFGPERAGLANEDVILADSIISVPVNPAFPSLNLAQCTLLCAYEWQRHAGEAAAEVPEPAQVADVTRLLDHLQAELDTAGFFYPEHKRKSMVANLDNLFRRASLTDQDVRTLRGVVRALAAGQKREG